MPGQGNTTTAAWETAGSMTRDQNLWSEIIRNYAEESKMDGQGSEVMTTWIKKYLKKGQGLLKIMKRDQKLIRIYGKRLLEIMQRDPKWMVRDQK